MSAALTRKISTGTLKIKFVSTHARSRDIHQLLPDWLCCILFERKAIKEKKERNFTEVSSRSSAGALIGDTVN